MLLQLTATEARVLASLVEKSITTPQYFPMTVNAIMLAANQKSSRNPVMALTEGEVGNALTQLQEHKLVARDDFGARVPKWRHNFHTQMLLKTDVMAVLATLMLRGPQTLSELRAHSAPLNGPATAEGIQTALDDLADRAQPLCRLLPRGAGQKEARHAHLLCGDDFPAMGEEPAEREAPARPSRSDALEALEQRILELERRVAQLEGRNDTEQG